MNDRIKERADTTETLRLLSACLNGVMDMKRTVVPELAADLSKDLGDLLMQELSEMDRAIQEAANKIEQMMTEAKKKDTGVKLEVNGKILDACTTLMQAIMELVKNAKQLQKEIVAQGKGSASATDFYQRNHRWTEGLMSASKVVALGATLLVESADKVVGGKAKFEELMVASQEIAAATAQLVVASRVKAARDSENMTHLYQSSKRVTEATGNVVATAKSCSHLVEDKEDMDFSKLSLHQAKKLEMESQVRVLELDNNLVKERVRLASLRKRHYHLAGE
jgi:huntingtin interacting protein 1